jgi:uncharacterized protein (DUF1015 family)
MFLEIIEVDPEARRQILERFTAHAIALTHHRSTSRSSIASTSSSSTRSMSPPFAAATRATSLAASASV